jgi:hypothetical protein
MNQEVDKKENEIKKLKEIILNFDHENELIKLLEKKLIESNKIKNSLENEVNILREENKYFKTLDFEKLSLHLIKYENNKETKTNIRFEFLKNFIVFTVLPYSIFYLLNKNWLV